jgi:phospholipid transport system substrate-binding protein
MTQMRHLCARGFGLVIAMLFVVGANAGAGEVSAGSDDVVAGEEAHVDEFHQVLLEVMQSGHEFTGRVARLAPVVGELFDVATISRISLGRTWKALDEQDQLEFSVLLEELVVATYADRFDSFSGQSFHAEGVEPTRSGWVVKTQLEKSDGERVTLDYYFRSGKVFNVVADGVSDLSLRRADYNSIIKAEGYQQLLMYIRESIAKRKAGDADD